MEEGDKAVEFPFFLSRKSTLHFTSPSTLITSKSKEMIRKGPQQSCPLSFPYG